MVNDLRMKHEAQPVTRGVKYGLNVWVRLYPRAKSQAPRSRLPGGGGGGGGRGGGGGGRGGGRGRGRMMRGGAWGGRGLRWNATWGNATRRRGGLGKG